MIKLFVVALAFTSTFLILGPPKDLVVLYGAAQDRYFPAKPDPDPVGWDKYFFESEVRRAFEKEDFERLEKWITDIYRENPRFKDGTFKISVFYEGLVRGRKNTNAAYLEELERHQNWEKAYPDSVTRLVALAAFWKDYAWLARGSGWANTVSKEGWRLFRARIQRSAETLVLASKLPQKDLHWGRTAMTVGMAQSWKPELFETVLSMQKPLDPGFYPLHIGRAKGLLPRWLGEKGDWEAYATQISDEVGSDALYARIVFSLYTYYGNVFKETDASWLRTKNGLNELLETYPEATLLKNRAARLAVLAEDYDYATARFDEIGRLYHEQIWDDVDHFHKYLRFAQLKQLEAREPIWSR